MAKVIWTDPALKDLKGIIDFVAKDSPAYAERLGTKLVESPNKLEKFPLLGRVTPEFEDETIRELVYGSYRLIYKVKMNACYITAVIHGSRDFLRHIDPGDWNVG